MVDLPAGLVERARAFLAEPIDPPPARDAATVVLLRAGRSEPEVYLLRRAPSMVFAAGMHVFPGGSVDPRDVDAGVAWAGPAPVEWGRWFGCAEPLARALVCAAVRETFEESGVLLAGPTTDRVVSDTSGDDWEADRVALLDRSLPFAGLLRRRGLVLRSDLLRPWARWITPIFESRRFDTRFFAAVLPAGQRTRDVGGEADQVAWLPANAAVTAYEAGELPLLPPTAATLREIALLGSVDSVLAARPTIEPLMPRPILLGDRLRLVLYGAAGETEADAARPMTGEAS